MKYKELRTKIIDLAKANNYDEAIKLYNSDVVTVTDNMLKRNQRCIDINQNLAKQNYLDNTTQFNSVRYTILIFTVVAFLSIIFIAYILSKNIMNPLRMIKGYAERLSNYDFSTPIIITERMNLDKPV